MFLIFYQQEGHPHLKVLLAEWKTLSRIEARGSDGGWWRIVGGSSVGGGGAVGGDGLLV